MKKTISLFLAAILTLSVLALPAAAVSTAFNGTTAAKTPISSAEASVRFTKTLGKNYENAPTPPLAVENMLIVISGKNLLKLDPKTGNVKANAALKGSTKYAAVAPAYSNGVIYCALDNGIVQAVDFKTFKSLWVYKDAVGGQALTPVLYDSGYVYTAFWNDEDQKANYVCLSAKDDNTKSETESKKSTWTYSSKGGFYWAGAAAAGDYLLFGCDDGYTGSTHKSKIVAVNKKTGKTASNLAVNGDIRSSVAYNAQTASYYASSKAGYVYKFTFSTSSGRFDSSSLKSYKVSGSVTGTPVIHNKRLYVGTLDGSQGYIAVLNAETMKLIYRAQMKGHPQNAVLLSTAYENATGKVYIYSTYNSKPGGITVLEDSAGQTKAIKSELYSPSGSLSEYCISPIMADSDGTLYYKNDSGTIFAIERKAPVKLNFFQKLINAIRDFFKKIANLFKGK